MKFIIIFFFAALAMSYANDTECHEDQAGVCVKPLVEAVLGDGTDEEICTALKDSTDCLRSYVDKCLGDDADSEIKDELEELQKQMSDICEEGINNEKDIECVEEHPAVCVQPLTEAVVGDGTDEEICTALRTYTDCLRQFVEQCLGDDVDPAIEDGLEELKEQLIDICEEDENENEEIDEEIAECIEENSDYIFDCLGEALQNVVPVLVENDITDEDTLTCSIYDVMGECFVERAEEKCGEAAAEVVRKELEYVPEEIYDACENAAETEFTGLNILDGKEINNIPSHSNIPVFSKNKNVLYFNVITPKFTVISFA